MIRIPLRKTYLLERTGDRLVFRTESTPLLKGLLLAGIILLFIISMATGSNRPAAIRYAIIAFCLLGFVVIGSARRVIFDRFGLLVRSEGGLYSLRRWKEYRFAECRGPVVTETAGRHTLLLELEAGEPVPVAVSRDAREAALWQQAVQDILEKAKK